MRSRRAKATGFESPLARAPRFMPQPGECLISLHRKRRLVQQVEQLAEDAKMDGLAHAAASLRDAAENLRIALLADTADSLQDV